MHALETTRQPPPMRLALWLAAPALVLVALLMSLSDRAPLLIEDLARAIEIDGYVRGGAMGYGPWTIAHFFLWFALTWFVLVAIGRPGWVMAGGVIAFASSLAIEGLQVLLTSSRAFQASDVAANLIGCACGAVVAAATLALFDLRRRHPSSP